MRAIGIDIGSSSIKIVEAVLTAKGATLTRFVKHSLGKSPGFDPEIEILDFLRKASETLNFEAATVVMAVSQDRVSVRNKIFPFKDRFNIVRSLPFELEEDIPFSTETAIYEAKMIKFIGNSAEVLACATPKSRVEEALNRAQSFELDLLSAEGISLANCWENWNEPIPSGNLPETSQDGQALIGRPIQIILHLGHSRTLVLAMEGSTVIGVRCILWGLKQVAEAIAKRYELPIVEAQKELESKAFILTSKDGASYDQIVFSDTIASEFKDLCRELKLTLLEFQTEFEGRIQSVGITGGGSQILNLHAYLTQQLDVPANLKKTLGNFTSVNFEVHAGIDCTIGVALGLALEGLKKPRNPAVNFLRAEFAKKGANIEDLWSNWKSPVLIFTALFISFFIYSTIRVSLTENLDTRITETLKVQGVNIAQVPKKGSPEAGIKKFISKQERRTRDIQSIQKLTEMNSALDILKKVNDAIPAKNLITLNVKKLLIKDSVVSIEGTLAKQNEIPILQKALASAAKDGKVNSQQPLIKGSGFRFSFTFSVDRGLRKN